MKLPLLSFGEIQSLMKRRLRFFAKAAAMLSLICYWAAGPMQAQTITIAPVTPTVVNCFPFGITGSWTPAMGFIYRNVPAFTLAVGDQIRFDLGAQNDFPIRRNIFFAAANINPAAGGATQNITTTAWVQVVPDTQTPADPDGDAVVGNYELVYTATAPFTFAGGGFIIGFTTSQTGDNTCSQVMVSGSSTDASGFFHRRFYARTGLLTGTVLDNTPGDNGSIAAFRIVATGGATEIDVRGNGISIPDGDATPAVADNTDFGSANVCNATSSKTFTIHNTGTGVLNLSGTPIVTIGGTNAGDFTVTTQPATTALPANGSTSFVVTFNPSATGLRTATLSFANSDVNENPYNFSIQGTGTADVAATLTSPITICQGQSGTLTATGGGSYLWSTGATTASITVSPTTATNYTVTVTSAAGCPTVLSTSVTVVTITATVTSPQTICQGQSATLTATGGTAYLWSNGATTPSITVSPAATTNYTVTVTGASNCSVTLNTSVTVNTAPVVTCPANVTANAPSSQCSAIVNYPPATATGSPAPVITYSHPSGSSFPVGTTTVTVIATNACGSHACTFTVTVNDVTPPTITCPPSVVLNNATGVCSAPHLYTMSVADNCNSCAIPSVIPGYVYVGSFGGHGYFRSLTGMTWPNASSAATALGGYLTTISSAAEQAFLSSNTPGGHWIGFNDGVTEGVWAWANGEPVTYTNWCGGEPNDFPPGEDYAMINWQPGGCWNDFFITGIQPFLVEFNCAPLTATQVTGLASGSNFPVGTTTNTFSVTDNAGNTNTCSFTVTVNDVEAPVIHCQADVTVNAAPGTCGAVVPFSTGPGGLFGSGAFDLGYYAFDPLTFSNNSSLPISPSSGSYNNTTGMAQDPTNGDIYIILNDFTTSRPLAKLNPTTGVATIIGNTNRSFAAIAFKSDGTLYGVTGNQGANPNSFFSINKNTGVPTFLLALTSTSNHALAFHPGTGLFYHFSFSVFESINPVTLQRINIPISGFGMNNNPTAATYHPSTGEIWLTTFDTDIISYTTTGFSNLLGYVNINLKGMFLAPDGTYATDNCDATIAQTCGLPGGSTFPVGTTTNCFTATDPSGNSANCSFTVTVIDNQPPAITCPANITASATSAAGAVVNYVAPVGTDNCPGPVTTLTAGPASGSTFPIGTTTVTYTVTDASGNTANCSFTVTVTGLAPAIVCPADITVNNAPNNCGNNVSFVATETTAVPPSVITYSHAPGSFFPVGTTTVTATATNPVGASSCSFTITVIDNQPPNALCSNVNAFLNAGGNASITAAQVNNGSSDNCGIATFSLSNTAFSCANLGANTVTLTVTDVNGNSSTCVSTVTIIDSIAPIALCTNASVNLDSSGNGIIGASAVGLGSSDNCGTFTASLSPNTFTCANIGPNTVTLTLTDPSGNSSNCTATVTVNDVTPPVVVCQNATVFLDNSGNGVIGASVVGLGTADACTTFTATLTPNTFTCANVGANTVTFTATDVFGNSASCTATVTVVDNVAPAALCQNVTVQLDATGNGSTTAAAVDNGSSDACGISSLSLSNSAFTCANVGPNPVTLTVTDVNGNTSTCTATVTVEDNVAPVALCQNVTVQLDATGNGSTTAAAVDNGSSDACGIASLSLSNTAFTCASVGPNTVTLTVTDVNGNSSTCTATVTVEDNVAPVALCQNVTVPLDSTGSAVITATAVDNGSSDACGIASLSLSNTAFTCANVGPNTVTLTVTDVNGNSSTCTATVTVEDLVAPVALCQNVTVQLDATGNGSTSAAAVDNGSSDACGIASLGLSNTAFTCANVGANPMTLTVTDVNGNSSTCTATVTVEDNVAPTALCQDFTVTIPNGNTMLVTSADINNGSSDACGIAGMSVSPNSFTCAHEGANTVVLTVVDVNGNTASCTATVTVLNDPLVCSVTGTDATCFGFCDGSADLSVTGGCGSYSYSWSNGASTEDLTGLCAGTYSVVIMDANGHSTTCSVVIDQDPQVSASISCCADTFACIGETIDIPVSFTGAGPWTFSWTDGVNTNTVSTASNPYIISVLVNSTTTISLTAVSSNSTNCAGVICGTQATIGANQCTDSVMVMKFALCHRPPGNPSNEHTLYLPLPAINAHLAHHPDMLGTCDGLGPDTLITWEETSSECTDLCLNTGVISTQVNGNCVSYTLEVACDTACYGETKVEICHVPPGNPANEHTIHVGAGAVSAHMAHGDYLGPCTNAGGGQSGGNGNGNGNGQGNGNGNSNGNGGNGNSLTICHIPPGNPANAHTITISPNAWPAHQNHGDTQGPCPGDVPVTASSFIDISIPCGTVSNVQTSLGLPVTIISQDSVTGLTGIRIENLPDCEYGSPAFTISYDVCGSCSPEVCAPLVAYKSGNCVQYEQAVMGSVFTPWNRSAGPEYNDITLGVFPNPTNGQVTVRVMCEQCTDPDANYDIQLVDGTGRVIAADAFNLVQNGWFEMNVDLSAYSNGIYNVVLQGLNRQWSVKIVKQ